MSKYKTIVYNGRTMRVKRAVYRFLKADRQRAWRESHWDRDHRDGFDIDRNDLDRHIRDRAIPFEDVIADRSEAAYLRRLLGGLTETQRRRVRMYFFDELTYRQIATVEHVDESTIRDSVKRSIKKLRENFLA